MGLFALLAALSAMLGSFQIETDDGTAEREPGPESL